MVAVALLTTACHRPTEPDPYTRPAGISFTVSGTITGYRGGPLSGVPVGIYPCNIYWSIPCSTSTDAHGHYEIRSPGASPVSLAVGGERFVTAWKYLVTAQDSPVDFVLHPAVSLNVGGDMVSSSVHGDELISGDDVLFGGLCERRPCKVMMFNEFVGNPRRVELHLRWSDSSRHLALYKYDGDPDSIPSPQKPPQRFTGSSDVVATTYVSGYFDALAVGFEDAGGAPPQLEDSQSFELVVSALP
jgi:hypothetical protein